jgi:hypothetical protein
VQRHEPKKNYHLPPCGARTFLATRAALASVSICSSLRASCTGRSLYVYSPCAVRAASCTTQGTERPPTDRVQAGALHTISMYYPTRIEMEACPPPY